MSYFPFDRMIRDHWVYKNSNYYHLWSEMLFCARYTDSLTQERWEGEWVDLDYGQFIFGRKSWSARLGVSEQTIRTIIKKFIKEDMIELKVNYRKCTTYEIKNYRKFNHLTNHQIDQSQQGFEGVTQPPDQPPINHLSTTYNKVNKVNNKTPNQYTAEFDEFWSVYPKRVGKAVAFGKWKKVVKTESFEFIMQCTRNYAKECEVKKTEDQYIKHPSTFLEKERYKDNQLLVIGGGQSKPKNTPVQPELVNFSEEDRAFAEQADRLQRERNTATRRTAGNLSSTS